jgi:hypothetical protein
MSQEGFQPKIPVVERAKTVHALDRAASVISLQIYLLFKKRVVSSNDCTTVQFIAVDSTQHMKFVPHKTVHAS